jgi:hypothetical protein
MAEEPHVTAEQFHVTADQFDRWFYDGVLICWEREKTTQTRPELHFAWKSLLDRCSDFAHRDQTNPNEAEHFQREVEKLWYLTDTEEPLRKIWPNGPKLPDTTMEDNTSNASASVSLVKKHFASAFLVTFSLDSRLSLAPV